MRKSIFPLATAVCAFILFISVVGCKKTTTNNTVVQDSIYYSPWIKLAMTPTDAGDTSYYQVINASKVTQNALSRGAVLSYIGIVAYPAKGDTSVQDLLAFNGLTFLSPGSIEVDSYGYKNDLSYNSSNANPLLYRYVVIPGNVLASTALHNLTQQQLHSMSLTDIQKAASTPAGSSSGSSLHFYILYQPGVGVDLETLNGIVT